MQSRSRRSQRPRLLGRTHPASLTCFLLLFGPPFGMLASNRRKTPRHVCQRRSLAFLRARNLREKQIKLVHTDVIGLTSSVMHSSETAQTNDDAANILSKIATVSVGEGDSFHQTTLALACWSLSTGEGARLLQGTQVSAYCQRILRTSLPPLLHSTFIRAVATGLGAAMKCGAPPFPTRACIDFFAELADAAFRRGDATLLALLLRYFAQFDLANKSESQKLGSALLTPAILLSSRP